jgi:hypothetical protein
MGDLESTTEPPMDGLAVALGPPGYRSRYRHQIRRLAEASVLLDFGQLSLEQCPALTGRSGPVQVRLRRRSGRGPTE